MASLLILCLLPNVFNLIAAEMAAAPKITLNDGKHIFSIGVAADGFLATPNGELGFIENLKHAIDVGYRYFDCPPGSPGENYIGRAISAKIEDGTVKREDLFVSGQFWNTGYKREEVEKHANWSLTNLGLDYFDLYLLQWPRVLPNPKDEKEQDYLKVDYVDPWKGMEDLQEKGLTKSIGISNFNVFQIETLLKHTKIVPVVNQLECHPYDSRKSVRDICAKNNIKVVSVSSFGPYTPPVTESKRPELLTLPEIKKIATDHEKSPEQILLRYQIQLGHSLLVPASIAKERFAEYFDIFDFELTADEMKILQELDVEEVDNWFERSN